MLENLIINRYAGNNGEKNTLNKCRIEEFPKVAQNGIYIYIKTITYVT